MTTSPSPICLAKGVTVHQRDLAIALLIAVTNAWACGPLDTVAPTSGEMTQYSEGEPAPQGIGGGSSAGGSGNVSTGGTGTFSAGGSGIVGTGGTGNVSTGGTGNTGGSGGTTSVPRVCDMTGTWAFHSVAHPLPDSNLSSAIQYSSSWLYYEFTQSGDSFEVRKSMNCGAESGIPERLKSAMVTFSDATLDAILAETMNSQVGRTGTFADDGTGGCEFSFEKWYSVTSLPASLASDAQADPGFVLPLDMSGHLGDALDWDNDGTPGIAYITEGLVSGIRHAIELSWNSFRSHDEYNHVPGQNSSDFDVRMDMDIAEYVTSATKEALKAGAIMQPNSDNSARFKRLPASSIGSTDAGTCANIAGDMPHNYDSL